MPLKPLREASLEVFAWQRDSPKSSADHPEQHDIQNNSDVLLGIYGKILAIIPIEGRYTEKFRLINSYAPQPVD